MKTYSVDIENGVKTALFALNNLMKEESIVNNQMLRVTGSLEELLVKAQNGEIEHEITKDGIITEQHLVDARFADKEGLQWSIL